MSLIARVIPQFNIRSEVILIILSMFMLSQKTSKPTE